MMLNTISHNRKLWYFVIVLRIEQRGNLMKRWRVAFYFCLLVILVGCYRVPELNDIEFFKEEILKYYDGEAIEILTLEEIDEYTSLIFYKVDNEYGYSKYEKSDSKTSELSIQAFSSNSFDSGLVPYGNPDKFLVVVFSDGTELSKVQVTVNEEVLPSQEIEIGLPTLTIFDLNLPAGTDYFEMEVSYFDESGTEIF